MSVQLYSSSITIYNSTGIFVIPLSSWFNNITMFVNIVFLFIMFFPGLHRLAFINMKVFQPVWFWGLGLDGGVGDVVMEWHGVTDPRPPDHCQLYHHHHHCHCHRE